MLIVPVCGEKTDCLTSLMQLQAQHRVLIIVLLNRPEGHVKSDQWFAENTALVQSISSQYEKVLVQSETHQLLYQHHNPRINFDVLLLNFNSNPFKANKGVGLARRIAADTALGLIAEKKIKHAWIFSTDADVVLPVNYFKVINSAPVGTSAISLNFEHCSDNCDLLEIQKQYDFKLRYYQSGIKYMGVKYDYIPLGSTLIIDAGSYVKVRGFPNRSGGEDFYILNKLAKIGLIYQPENPVIKIKIRFSDRVPFGTGPAITQIQQLQSSGEPYTYYHPEIFFVLREWRESLLHYYQKQQVTSNDGGLNNHWQVSSVLNQAMKQIKSYQRWQQFIHEWFDAFKILKSVHFLQQKHLPIELDVLKNMDSYQQLNHPS